MRCESEEIMRTQQFSVRVNRVLKPEIKHLEKDFIHESIFGNSEETQGFRLLSVYADTNNFYEAFCAAYNETVELILKNKEMHRRLSKKEKELYTNEMEVNVIVHYSELINPVPFTSKCFSATSKNIYEAVTIAFNKVLYESQKYVDLPTFGRKEHYECNCKRRLGELHTILDYVFTNEEQLEGPDIVIPDKYLHIDGNVFKGREDIVNITLPEGLMKIYRGAFMGCKNLKNINIPESVISIGNEAFAECISLTNIKIPYLLDALYHDAFRGCSNLRKISLPDLKKRRKRRNDKFEIRGQSFAYCTSLKEITITAGVDKIDGDAFTGCSALKNIFVTDDSKLYASIDGVLFNKDCTVLIRYPEGKTGDTYTIPDTVEEIGEDAFSGCKHLKSLYIPKKVSKISNTAFTQSDYTFRAYDRQDGLKYVQSITSITNFYVYIL